MKATFYTFLFLGALQLSLVAQTTILDFETAETSTTFQYFGSPLDGSLNEIIDNPDKTGGNTSDKVAKFVKPAVAEVWAGAFSNPNPTTPVDLTSGSKIRVMVWMDHIGSLSVKLEGSPDGGQNWITTVANTKINEWEMLEFDANLPSIEGPNAAAAGHIYARVVLFFDFGTAGTGTEQVYYFDNIVTDAGGAVCNPVLDYETEATTTVFQYFGSPLDGSLNTNVANPNPTGINESANVARFVKPAVAEVWAGAFSNPNPVNPVNLIDNGKIKIKVHMDHIGSLTLKLEGSPDGGQNWLTTVANTKVNEWEELTFDANLPSIEAPFASAFGHTYTRIVLFFDFGTAGTGTEVVSYFDDICVEGSTGPAIRTVNFEVNMNNYSGNFDQVYISGNFNNWSGDANPLTDENADGLWVGSIDFPVGAFEYKVTLDNWLGQEAFAGTEECTVTDPSGQFTNRRLLVTTEGQQEKFCYNSCYACGEEVKITFRLGMGSEVPNADGVWLAGGGNFEIPGGRYKMKPVNDYYELVVSRKVGFKSHFTFANGPCADYSCKEVLEGLPCGDPNNYNDRFLPPVAADTIYATCFENCSATTTCALSSDEEIISSGLFDILGNPVSGNQLNIQMNTRTATDLTIQNVVGAQLQHLSLKDKPSVMSVDVSALKSGLYTITITTGEKSQTKKWFKF
ncbi:MAG: T9SS type A sorting domain-containing protein [Saprospiraceae bacterium]|nr:T9SS type A sorting domain-containing protein [Saprospiraceae bacterium]